MVHGHPKLSPSSCARATPWKGVLKNITTSMQECPTVENGRIKAHKLLEAKRGPIVMTTRAIDLETDHPRPLVSHRNPNAG